MMAFPRGLEIAAATEAANEMYGSQMGLINALNLGCFHAISGQTGNNPKSIDPEEGVVEGGIGPQTERALENILAIMRAEYTDATPEYISSMRVYVKKGEDSDKVNNVLKDFLGRHGPGMRVKEVSEIPLVTENTLVEVSANAVYPSRYISSKID